MLLLYTVLASITLCKHIDHDTTISTSFYGCQSYFPDLISIQSPPELVLYGILLKDIENGTLTMKVKKRNFFKVFTFHKDICSIISCPQPATESLLIKKTIDIPSNAMAGHYEVILEAKDQDDALIFCYVVVFKLDKRSTINVLD